MKQYESKVISKIHPKTAKAISEFIFATWMCSHTPFVLIFSKVEVLVALSCDLVCSH